MWKIRSVDGRIQLDTVPQRPSIVLNYAIWYHGGMGCTVELATRHCGLAWGQPNFSLTFGESKVTRVHTSPSNICSYKALTYASG